MSRSVVRIAKVFFDQVFPSAQKREVIKWMKARGDNTLRLDYDLGSESVVFDLGGYQGQWASDIFAKYLCNVFVFEPLPSFAKDIKNRFLKNPKIRVFDVALGRTNARESIYYSQDATSFFKSSGFREEIQVRQASSFIRELKVEKIDLMKVNIEGGEYDLLESLLEENMVTKIENIQVQFHDFIPNAMARMRKIQDRLAETHELTYQYKFVWENWRLVGAR